MSGSVLGGHPRAGILQVARQPVHHVRLVHPAVRSHELRVVEHGAVVGRLVRRGGQLGDRGLITTDSGARVEVGSVASLDEVLFGPSRVADGTTNLIGALRRAMATTGYTEVKELQRIEVVVAPHQPS